MSLVLPVIHHLDLNTTLSEGALAIECGADGLFLISMDGEGDDDLPALAATLKGRFRGRKVGINLLSRHVTFAYQAALEFGLDMVWADSAGVSSRGLTEDGRWLQQQLQINQGRGPALFASVAFKYQPEDPDPPAAAAMAQQMGAVPTTSGMATGKPPSLDKISGMRASTQVLAVASGLDCDNVAAFVPLLTHILVSTGVSSDGHHFDRAKLTRFVQTVKNVACET